MWAVLTDVYTYGRVGFVLVMTVSPAKMAESIEMPFGGGEFTHVGPKNMY